VKRILVPIDFSRVSSEAVESAVSIANQYKAALTFLHVIDISEQVESGTAQELMKRLSEEGSVQMEKLVSSFSGQVEAQTLLEEGLPWEVIAEKSKDFDLVILGKSRGRNWNFFAKHTVRRVVENAACPVVVVQESVSPTDQKPFTQTPARTPSKAIAAVWVFCPRL